MATGDIKPRSAELRAALENKKGKRPVVAAMLSVAETCIQLGVSKWTLYRLMQEGELASAKVGRRRLIPLRAIEDFIQQQLEEKGGWE